MVPILWLAIIFKISSIVFHRRKKVIQVRNDMQEVNYDNFYFWVNDSCKNQKVNDQIQ